MHAITGATPRGGGRGATMRARLGALSPDRVAGVRPVGGSAPRRARA